MDSRHEILDAIEIIVNKAIKDNVTEIQNGTVISIQNNNLCTVNINGRQMQSVQYYGDAPTINKQYRVFIPNGNSSRSFIISGGSSGIATTVSVNIGSVVKLPEGSTPTVTNSGTEENVILDFGLVDGNTGNGISSVALNADYTLTLNFTDGNSYTTTSIRGEKGDTGDVGPRGEDGTQILVQSEQPSGQQAGSFWYQVI